MKFSAPILAAAAVVMAAPAFAAEVNIYTSRQPQLIEPIFEAFEKSTGVDVKVLFANKGLVERLQLEGDASPADLYVTADIGSLMQAVDAGVVEPLNNAILETTIPAEFRDPDGRWFGVTTRARIVYASKERVAEGDVTTYEDLASEKWKGRVCTRSGRHAYNLALFSAMEAHHGAEAAKAWIEGLKSNLARKPQGNDRAQVKAIWAGECDIAIGNTYYMGKMLEDPEQIAWADSVRIVFPKFEDGGAHLNISGMSLTKSSPNRENAIKLMEYMVSDETQKLYAALNYEYPVRAGVEPSNLVKSWGAFDADTISLAEIAQGRASALRMVDEVGFDD